MKKLIGIIVVLVVIGAVGIFLLSLFAGKIIQTGVLKFGPEIAQVDIELERAHISFLSGAGGLEGFKVHNPEGFSGDHAFYAEHLALDIDPMSILGDKIVIEEILIIGPHIQFEQRGSENNLKKILENVQSLAGESTEEQTEASQGKKLEIKRFILQEAKVGVGVGTKPVSITIPTIELTGLGSGEEGITASEVIKVLLTEITRQVTVAISQNPDVILKGGSDFLKQAGDSGNSAIKALGGLFGGKKDEEEKEDN